MAINTLTIIAYIPILLQKYTYIIVTQVEFGGQGTELTQIDERHMKHEMVA